MNRTRACFDTFAIIDSFLPKDSFHALSTFADTVKYRQTTPGMSIWHSIEAENPKQSITTFAWAYPTIANMLTDSVRAALRDSSNLVVCPSGTLVDTALDAIREEADTLPSLIGQQGTDWVGLLASTFAYGPGARAAWHTDDHEYRGAFIYYIHANWEQNWGGELLLKNDTPGKGDGVYVSPLPNRLVILKGGTLHSVTSVSALTGGAARTSLAGFFVTQSFSKRLMSGLPTFSTNNA